MYPVSAIKHQYLTILTEQRKLCQRRPTYTFNCSVIIGSYYVANGWLF